MFIFYLAWPPINPCSHGKINTEFTVARGKSRKKMEDKQVTLLTAKTPPKFIFNSFQNFYRRIHH